MALDTDDMLVVSGRERSPGYRLQLKPTGIDRKLMGPMLGVITDIDALVSWATTNSTTILLVGVALLAFAVGRKLLKKGT